MTDRPAVPTGPQPPSAAAGASGSTGPGGDRLDAVSGRDDSATEGSGTVGGTFLAIVYDSYQDPRFLPLNGAVQQVDELADALASFGYSKTVLANPGQSGVVDGLGQWAETWSGRSGHGPAVVAWSGHAEITAVGGLQLITQQTKNLRTRGQFYTAEDLASLALSSGADQILILLDTCHAGAGARAALDEALTAWADRTLPEPRTAWLGILAACQAHEPATGARGLLLETVLRLLRDGPSRTTGTSSTERAARTGAQHLATAGGRDCEKRGRYRHEWSVRNEGITGEALALAPWRTGPTAGRSPSGRPPADPPRSSATRSGAHAPARRS
ncbi:hypothetical protein ABCR94_31855 [Streptomyces sp. 21So2-11]|uniref:hypothetical protein n=1 Tax=Streptomyces sp. 21So2-11 TaxID=3144408 RepID=UPI003219BF17